MYERGLNAFEWPHKFEIWLTYLSKFVSRYGRRKVERARDLFEQAVHNIPPKYALYIFFMYARFEEDYGLIRHSLDVLHRCAYVVPQEERLNVYKLLIASVRHISLGRTTTLPSDSTIFRYYKN